MWLTLTALLLTAGPDSAEALFKKSEEALLKAKTLQTPIEMNAVMGKDTLVALKGKLLIADGNLLRLELEGQMRGKEDKMTMLSDGTKMHMTSAMRPGNTSDTPKELSQKVKSSVTRSSVFIGLFTVAPKAPDGEEVDPTKLLPVSDFKLGKKEAVGKVEAQILEYQLKLPGAKEPVMMQVWLDTKTNLPLKRICTITEGKNSVVLTETYGGITLDGKIDPKEFTASK